MGYQMYAASHEKWDPPHKKLSPRLIWIAEAALRKAWEIATSDKRPNASWRTADEDDLTLDLFEALKDTVWKNRMIPGFNKEIFSTINREPKVRNHNGEHPDKMPDLLIEFKEIPSNVRPSQCGIFIECKPVDSKHPVGTHYCGKGIIRYINGDYAWSMQDAIMLGYAAQGYEIGKKLTPHLSPNSKSTYATKTGLAGFNKSTRTSPKNPTLHSIHARNFTYLENNQAAPAIELYHIWLNR